MLTELGNHYKICIQFQRTSYSHPWQRSQRSAMVALFCKKSSYSQSPQLWITMPSPPLRPCFRRAEVPAAKRDSSSPECTLWLHIMLRQEVTVRNDQVLWCTAEHSLLPHTFSAMRKMYKNYRMGLRISLTQICLLCSIRSCKGSEYKKNYISINQKYDIKTYIKWKQI